MKKSFVFFGCSWTYGKFISLAPGQKKTEYSNAEELDQANLYAYRSLIASHFDADQELFAVGASSNQQQFRFASQYFLTANWDKIGKESCGPRYVFWFITSTARTEFFDAIAQAHVNEFFTHPSHSVTKSLAVHCYDHNQELEKLAYQMQLWNAYFETQGIQNVWIDTFNHHNYPFKIKNYIKLGDRSSDIMSNMCVKLGFTDFENSEFHTSEHKIDDNRSKFLVDQGMLSSQTLHPTVKGHQLIADILIPKIEQHLSSLNNG